MGAPDRQSDYAQLAPAFALSVALLIRECKKQGLNVELFEGRRTQERQQWLYQQGRSKAATAMKSWHFYGLAADVVPVSATGEFFWPTDSDPRWETLLSVAQTLDLTTGLHWTSITDACHVQPKSLAVTPTDKSIQLYNSGGLPLHWQTVGMIALPDKLLRTVYAQP